MTFVTMEGMINQLHYLREGLGWIQRRLNFENWDHEYPQFFTAQSLGRVALLAFGLGASWGIHGCLFLVLSFYHINNNDDNNNNYNDNNNNNNTNIFWTFDRLSMLWQWSLYVWAMCTFHLLEFFTTAIYNPTVTSSDSFLVNHSKAYTAAALIAITEFSIRFFFFPNKWRNVYTSSFETTTTTTTLLDWFVVLIRYFSILLLIASQAIRTWAMKTCGESFNHLIQTSKKDNHVLITSGIYSILRHPSYVGFYYWSISTQLVLSNYFSAMLFAIAAWMFFRRRIPYEEECLLELFPDEYPNYARRTWVGIPFIPNMAVELSMDSNSGDGGGGGGGGGGDEQEQEQEGEEVQFNQTLFTTGNNNETSQNQQQQQQQQQQEEEQQNETHLKQS